MCSKFRQAHNFLMKTVSSIGKRLSWCFLFPTLWLDLREKHVCIYGDSFHNLCSPKCFLGLTSSLSQVKSSPTCFPYCHASLSLFPVPHGHSHVLYFLLCCCFCPIFPCAAFSFLLLLYLFMCLLINFYKILLHILLFRINSSGLSPNGLTVGPVL